jgi:hypothetical protein
VASRPLLRVAEDHERLHSCGTVVRAKLRNDPRSMDGLFKTTDRGLSHTQLLHSRLTRMCALAEVDIDVQGPDDPSPMRIVRGNDWASIPAGELFRRLYRREEASHLDRVLYDAYEKLFADQATELRDSDGQLAGRAMFVSGFELMLEGLRWMGRPPEGLIYVGGYQSDELPYCMGAFAGRPLTADRLRAWPIVTLDEFRSWVETQADRIRNSQTSTAFEREEAGYLARGLGAVAPGLPCAQGTSGPLDRDGLADWLTGRQEILLLAAGTLAWMDRSDGKTLFFTFDGRQLYPPENALLLLINPPWLFPEEVLARPRDERFAYAVQSPSTWNLDAWWYDTGNFGGVGLTVRTIAEAWQLSIEDAVRIMEPLHVQGDRDLRPRIETDDGEPIRVTAIRMKRPSASP